MSKKNKMGLGEQYKRLHEWIEERRSFDDYSRLIEFAKQEGYDPYDFFSETDFKALEEKYELEGWINLYLRKAGNGLLASFLCLDFYRLYYCVY